MIGKASFQTRLKFNCYFPLKMKTQTPFALSKNPFQTLTETIEDNDVEFSRATDIHWRIFLKYLKSTEFK